jgi:hypothetical protein
MRRAERRDVERLSCRSTSTRLDPLSAGRPPIGRSHRTHSISTATERGVSGMMGGTGTGRRIPASLGTIATS